MEIHFAKPIDKSVDGPYNWFDTPPTYPSDPRIGQGRSRILERHVPPNPAIRLCLLQN